MREPTKTRAVGKWRAILSSIGLDQRYLTGKHSDCPICEDGRDRFRFDDKDGNGTWICNKCGSSDGVGFVMRWKRVPFGDACKMIEDTLPSAVADVRGARKAWSARDLENRGMAIWDQANRLDGFDAPSKYLRRRGIEQPFPAMLRSHPKMSYRHDDKSRTYHPAMIARFVSPDASVSTFHVTYLDGSGQKASVPTVRKMLPGKIPDGGAVRLARSAETMGIAEGIETAMSAMQVFEIPVWSALSANGLMKWEPPELARHIIVFGDADVGFDGQCKAYALAHRLKTKGLTVEVRIPDFIGTDWNDYLQSIAEKSHTEGML